MEDKQYCERCFQEIKGNFDEHLHGWTYLRTYIPKLFIKDYLKEELGKVEHE